MYKKEKRFTQEELSLIKNTFKDQNQLLVSLRKFLLQGDMKPGEEEYLRSIVGIPAILEVTRKALCPPLDKGAVLGGTVDLFTSLDLNATPLEHASLHIKARRLVRDFLEQGFKLLSGKKVADLIIFDELVTDTGDEKENYINFMARNTILSHLDGPGGLIQLLFLAEDEDIEQIRERIKKDSSK